MRLKSCAYELIKSHIARAENFLDRKVKYFCTDNGREFANDDLTEYFDNKGIKHELTNPYTPQQNGICDRYMQTAVDGARTILYKSKLNLSFWQRLSSILYIPGTDHVNVF